MVHDVYSRTSSSWTRKYAAAAASPPTKKVETAPYRYPPKPPVAPLPRVSSIDSALVSCLQSDSREVCLESAKYQQYHAGDTARDDQTGLSRYVRHVRDEGDETADEVRRADSQGGDV
jgi:hypothetical protein